jgi:hypothetical protein
MFGLFETKIDFNETDGKNSSEKIKFRRIHFLTRGGSNIPQTAVNYNSEAFLFYLHTYVVNCSMQESAFKN